MVKLSRTYSNFEREPLLSPLGFKGGYLTELWQSIALMESENGFRGIGLGTQSTLWSDADVFTTYSESAGNALMFLITEYAMKLAREISFETPIDLLEALLPEALIYGRTITGKEDLRPTFALNALVAIDNAAWILYCRENNTTSFDDMIPADVRPALSRRHGEVACIPLMSYGITTGDVIRAVDEGHFLLKIKIGSDPDKDGDLEKMLNWDINRLSTIHAQLKDRQTPYTKNGHISYYLDANGRYDNKDRLMRLLDSADKIGALDRIVILEEPFAEDNLVDVSNIPAPIAADESAHTDKDALERIQMGYSAIALKPIAKTMSMSLKIAKIAHERGVPCFCADLTVNPVLVDWNKNVAARLAPLPGLNIGAIETNGHQNYANWAKMKTYHPLSGASWTNADNGLFYLDDSFYASSGGMLLPSKHYSSLVP